MKKILIVVKNLALGGVSNVIFSYYSALRKYKDLQIDFVSGNPIEDRYKNAIEDGHLYIIKARDKAVWKYIWQLIKIITAGKYDVVHVHGNSAFIFPELLAAKMANVRIRIAHCHNTTCNHPELIKYVDPLFQKLYTHRLACGNDAGKWMFGDRSFITLKNGIQLSEHIFSEVNRRNIRQKLGVEDNVFLLGHIGNFNYQKNHDLLIKVFAEYLKKNKNAKLLLVGDGELREQTQSLVKQLKIESKVIFYGVSSNVKLLLDAMDVFVLTSRYEGLPCVLIEAQAHGLPCIVSNNVTAEACMSEHYETCKNMDSLDEWCNLLDQMHKIDKDRALLCYNNQYSLKINGYDIEESASSLHDLYFH